MERKRLGKFVPVASSLSARHFYDHKKDNFSSGSWSCGQLPARESPGRNADLDELNNIDFQMSSSDEEPNIDGEYLKAKI